MSWKLFSLVSCIDDVEPLFESDTVPIESIEAVGNHVILGSGNGHVVSIALLEESQSKERIFVENTTVLPQGRPVVQLKALTALNRLLALSDGSVYVLALDSLRILGAPCMRSVSCVALNECPNTEGPLAIPMAVGLRRRQVAVADLLPDRMNVALELDTDDIPVALAFDGGCICYATSSHYYLIDLGKRATRPLFPVKNDDVAPVVRRIAKNEFLLTGVHNLGMFVTSDGISNRPPISWEDESPVDVALCASYAIVLSQNFLSVFSVQDQGLKQKMSFTGGQRLCTCDGEVFVASRRRIYQLKPVHWEKQVDALLTANMVDEALQIASNAQKVGSKEEYAQRFRRIQQRGAFIKLTTGDWKEARDLLLQSQCNAREVISLYGDLLPSSSTFVRSIPPLHNITDIASLAPTHDLGWRQNSERFLLDYLLCCREEPWTSAWRQDIVLALLKLSSEHDHDSLFSLAANSNVTLTQDLLEDARHWLTKRGRLHAVALLDWFGSKQMEALKMWDRLLSSQITDQTFPSTTAFLVDLLLQCTELSLIMEACRILMKYDERGVSKVLLLAPGAKNVKLDVVEKLLEGNKRVFLDYLEEKAKLDCSSEIHTRLGLLFLDFLSSDGSVDETDGTRIRFRYFLFDSTTYDGDVLLRRMDVDSKLERKLVQERALLMGQNGQHEKALDMIIGECNDLAFAEEYCQQFSKGKERKFRHSLYSYLLKSLLAAQEKNKVLVASIMQLLNNEHVNVDLATLLPRVPDHWSLHSLRPFIMKNTTLQSNAFNSALIGSALSKARLMDALTEEKQLSSTKCQIEENNRCSACDQLFMEPNFVRYPNGSMIHTYCVRHTNLCPATQQVFPSSKQSESK